MTEHYFSNHPQSKSSPKTWKYQLRNNDYTFTSDVGVFSKTRIDYGTKLLAETFYPPDIDGDLLDLGCGYGPIGISLADHFPKRHVVMADVNERALELAVENAQVNGVENAEILYSDRFAGIAGRSFAAIITNPPIRAGKQTVHQMFEEASEALKQNGELWVVIQKKQGAPSAKEKINQLFNNVEAVKKDKGYYVLRAMKC